MRVSIFVIAKNEEENLPSCLKSVKRIASEIIVVDTGSTDKTVEVARQFGAKVFNYLWDGNFANARNFAMSKCKGDWIIMLDADEYFDEKSIPIIRKAIQSSHPKKNDAIAALLLNIDTDTGNTIDSVVSVRIFRNSSRVHFVGRVHERLLHVDGSPIVVIGPIENLIIYHTGYSKREKERKDKGNRNLELLLREYEENPYSSDICAYIASTYLILNKYNQGLDFAWRAEKYNNYQGYSHREKNLFNILLAMRSMGMPLIEIKKVAEESILKFPDYPDYYVFIAEYYMESNQLHDAIASYEIAIRNVKKGIGLQSALMSKQASVYESLALCQYYLMKKEDALLNFFLSLKTDKYSFVSLKMIIKIFRDKELKLCLDLLNQIYDFQKIKDLLYVLKAALLEHHIQIIDYIHGYLIEKTGVPDYEVAATKAFDLQDYEAASKYFVKMHMSNPASYPAIAYTLCKWYMEEVATEYSYLKLKGYFSQITQEENESHLLFDDENWVILELIKVCVRYGRLDIIERLDNAIERLQLQLEVATLLYEYEQYEEAYYYYHQFVQLGIDIPEMTALNILNRMGMCCLCKGQDEIAIQAYEEALRINPTDYRPYEYLYLIYSKNDDIDGCREIINRGINFISDSPFFHEMSKKF
ncbi:glycosyltransferase [Heliophilum fasciatum]|uniref:Glycosyltransferase involved in cell wall biosynthesis n=1 Tax=Heliophilum fasciatum TaxID=35700 RepID=A0A4R2RN46_9FIRM|nr:glycosyltransferase [Heliophilum fasciatum]MCW2278815.1 glycosyltransferase involved in cell wall biosynthesis [Heliophilum fasciatum]TCP64099.1 glycosyltransferase involved in cell wall biosynthesis [Heliophilum fasciatum]